MTVLRVDGADGDENDYELFCTKDGDTVWNNNEAEHPEYVWELFEKLQAQAQQDPSVLGPSSEATVEPIKDEEVFAASSSLCRIPAVTWLILACYRFRFWFDLLYCIMSVWITVSIIYFFTNTYWTLVMLIKHFHFVWEFLRTQHSFLTPEDTDSSASEAEEQEKGDEIDRPDLTQLLSNVPAEERVFIHQDDEAGPLMLVRPSDNMCVDLKFTDPILEPVKIADEWKIVVDSAGKAEGTKAKYADKLLLDRKAKVVPSSNSVLLQLCQECDT